MLKMKPSTILLPLRYCLREKAYLSVAILPLFRSATARACLISIILYRNVFQTPAAYSTFFKQKQFPSIAVTAETAVFHDSGVYSWERMRIVAESIGVQLGDKQIKATIFTTLLFTDAFRLRRLRYFTRLDIELTLKFNVVKT